MCLEQSEQREELHEVRSESRETRWCGALEIIIYMCVYLALIWCLVSHWKSLSQGVLSDLHFKVTVAAVLRRLK